MEMVLVVEIGVQGKERRPKKTRRKGGKQQNPTKNEVSLGGLIWVAVGPCGKGCRVLYGRGHGMKGPGRMDDPTSRAGGCMSLCMSSEMTNTTTRAIRLYMKGITVGGPG